MSNPEPVIRIINANNVVENGALIVVVGAQKSGKTCVVENAILYSLDSFSATNFPPLYYGKSPDYGAKYFGKLFGEYLSHSNSESATNERQAVIWQMGYQKECEDAVFQRQGTDYVYAQRPVIAQRRSQSRLLFFFDDCDRKDDIDYACRCLAYTKNHRVEKTISIIETNEMIYLGSLKPQIVIFTSRLDAVRHVAYFTKLLSCTRTIANDLIETANTFIEPCKVALLINLHQWGESNHVRGLFIYEYDLVPPLDEELAKRVGGKSEKSQKHHSHRRRHHHRHHRHHISTSDFAD